MSLKQNIIYLYFKGKHLITSKSQYQYNHGQYLYFADLNLPQAFEVHFSNKDRGESKTQIGSNKLVEIPDEYFWNGALQIYAWVYLHDGTDDGETIYEVRIPLIKRAKPTDEEPLPVQQSAIDKAIAELNNAVDITNENADKTNADKTQVATIKEEVVTLKEEIDSTASAVSQDAQSARESADASEQSAQNSAESERKALDYSDEAKGYAQSALESKDTASQKAQVATDASAEAKGYRDEAETFKNEAEQAKQNIVDYRDETKGYRDEALTAKDDTQTIKGDVQSLKTQIDDTADNVFENAHEAYQSMISADNASLSASESAENASQSANEANQYATNASESASQAEEFKNQSATNVTHYPKVVDGYWYVWDASKNEYVNTNVDARGVKGDKGDIGNGIENTVLNNDYTLTINFTDGTQYTTPPIRGKQGEKGDQGETGDSGVYAGTEPPTDEDINVWIDTDGSADSGTVEDLIEDVNHLKSGFTALDLVDRTAIMFGYLNATGGEVYPNPAGANHEIMTDFIPVTAGNDYTMFWWGTLGGGYWHRLCWYDSSKAYINNSTYNMTQQTSGYFYKITDYTAPSNAAYVRISVRSYDDGVFSFYTGRIKHAEKPNWYDFVNAPHVTDSANVKSINHAGYSGTDGAPENTIPAFVQSKAHGFDFIECDTAMTSDGICVCIHDNTIDRTSDGTGNVRDMTYAQLQQYDFGSWKSAEYAGTKIPKLEEVLDVCKALRLHPYIEIKYNGAFTREEVNQIVNLVRSKCMLDSVTFISFSSQQLGWVMSAYKYARLGLITNMAGDSTINFTDWAQIRRILQILRNGVNSVFADVRKETIDPTHTSYIEGINKVYSYDFPVECWTVYDTRFWFGRVDKCVNGFTTVTYKYDDWAEEQYGL